MPRSTTSTEQPARAAAIAAADPAGPPPATITSNWSSIAVKSVARRFILKPRLRLAQRAAATKVSTARATHEKQKRHAIQLRVPLRALHQE